MPARNRALARKALLRRRQDRDPGAQGAALPRIVASIEAWLAPRFQPAAVLGAYWAMRGEPVLQDACARWHAQGWTIALPRVIARDAPLVFGRWTPHCAMRPGAFDVMEPDPFEVLAPDLLLVPCVGFDARGYRLGYGGGFYDRTLAQRPVPALGVAYEQDRIDGFEPEPHDRPLDGVATEAGLRDGGRSGRA
ncbi:MAG: 5-formyltetrahydrofolate cyclo-ligase [Burkholderiaceae bacterium]